MKEFYVKELPKNCKGCPCACFDHYEITCNLNEGLNLYDIVETIITKTGRKKKIYNYMTRPKECPLKTFKEYDKEIVKKICEELKEHIIYYVSSVMCENCGCIQSDNYIKLDGLIEVLNKIGGGGNG